MSDAHTGAASEQGAKSVLIYDTTLRDGAQGEGINFSVSDKMTIARLLDDLGVPYIEGGWPGSNPRDDAFFAKSREMTLANARLTAFGSTCRAGKTCAEDPGIESLLRAGTSAIAIVGKSNKFHVTHALKVVPEENLGMIERTMRYLKERVDEVIFDAEHIFDGLAYDWDYAMACLQAAVTGGADRIVLCDTNGGTLPQGLKADIERIQAALSVPLGVHAHNDSELAVANSIAAVEMGVDMVQGTINGLGERCGNANLISVIPVLAIKMGIPCLPADKLPHLTQVAHTIDEIANRIPVMSQPFVGRSAFAHKGGIHTSAVMKDPRTYEHIDPMQVGNDHRFLLSDLSGRAGLLNKAHELGIELEASDPAIDPILSRLKELENEGYQFEGADASFRLLIDRTTGRHPNYFKLHNINVNIDIKHDGAPGWFDLDAEATAMVDLEVGEVHARTRATGQGPVNAMDQALRKQIDKFYPTLKDVSLLDYKVRVLGGGATASVVRVLVRFGDGHDDWGTVGVSSNIIEASWQAIVDALEYKLVKDGVPAHE